VLAMVADLRLAAADVPSFVYRRGATLDQAGPHVQALLGLRDPLEVRCRPVVAAEVWPSVAWTRWTGGTALKSACGSCRSLRWA